MEASNPPLRLSRTSFLQQPTCHRTTSQTTHKLLDRESKSQQLLIYVTSHGDDLEDLHTQTIVYLPVLYMLRTPRNKPVICGIFMTSSAATIFHHLKMR